MKNSIIFILGGLLYTAAIIFGATQLTHVVASKTPTHVPYKAKFSTTTSNRERPLTVNPDWAISQWVFDPLNTSTCASDGNNCNTTTCNSTTGDGPCSTWAEIYWGRLGCVGDPAGCPEWNHDVTIIQMSGEPDPTFDIAHAFHPSLVPYANTDGAVASPSINITGTPTIVTAVSAVSVTSKNRATNQELTVNLGVNLGTGSASQGLILVNTTHPSIAGIMFHSAGQFSYRVSQPCLALTFTPNSGIPISVLTEVDTWAASDSITVEQWPNLYWSEVSAENVGTNGTGVVVLSHVNLADTPTTNNGNANTNRFTMGPFVQLAEVTSTRPVLTKDLSAIINSYNFGIQSGIYNSILGGGFYGGMSNASPTIDTGQFQMLAGAVIGNGNNGTMGFNGVLLGDDIALRASPNNQIYMTGYNYGILFELTQQLNLENGVLDFGAQGSPINSGIAGAANPLVWGSGGKINAATNATVVYKSATTAAATFVVSGGIALENSTTGCSLCGDAGSITCGITLSPAAQDAVCGATGFGGRAALWGGSSFVAATPNP